MQLNQECFLQRVAILQFLQNIKVKIINRFIFLDVCRTCGVIGNFPSPQDFKINPTDVHNTSPKLSYDRALYFCTVHPESVKLLASHSKSTVSDANAGLTKS